MMGTHRGLFLFLLLFPYSPIPLFPYSPIPLFPYSPIPLFPYSYSYCYSLQIPEFLKAAKIY
jgi:hypothetical protein